jgi:methionyl-tRNA synthetase
VGRALSLRRGLRHVRVGRRAGQLHLDPGYATDEARFARWWPASVHLVGKDILTTHAVYWSTLLMALGLDLPKTIYAHGWWTVNGEKMSKSRGNVVDPGAMADDFGVDPFRYFVLREVPFGQDGDFSRQAFIGRYNSDLANDLGNLVSRTLTMIERYADGRIPHRGADDDFEELVTAAAREVDNSLRDFQFHRALQEIWIVIDRANRHIETSAPWALAKNPDAGPHLGAVLYTLAETLRHIARLLSPFMPGTARAIFDSLGLADVPDGGPGAWGVLTTGQAIHKAPPLFPRLDAPRTAMTAPESTGAPPRAAAAVVPINRPPRSASTTSPGSTSASARSSPPSACPSRASSEAQVDLEPDPSSPRRDRNDHEPRR